MIPVHGYVILKVDFRQMNTISYGSLSLIIDSEYDRYNHVPEGGEVYSLPRSYNGPLQVGDIVYGNHLFVDQDQEYKKLDSGESLVMSDLYEAYYFLRNGELTMLHDRIMIKDIVEQSLPSWLISPNKKTRERIGKVIHTFEGSPVNVGDTIAYIHQAYFDTKFNGEPIKILHSTNRDVLAVIEDGQEAGVI